MSRFIEALEHRALFSGDMGGDRLGDAVDLGRVHAERTAEVQETVSGRDVDDYYQFRISRSQTISLLLTDLDANANLKVIDADGDLVARSNNRSSQSEFLSLDLKKGTYYLRVISADEKRTDYSLQASIGGDEALSQIAQFPAAAAADSFNIFVKIAGVPGESTDERFAKQVEALNYSWSIIRDDASDIVTGGGQSADKPKFSEFAITKLIDVTSPTLFLYSANAKHIASVTISLTHEENNGQRVFMVYRLNNVVIGSVHTSSAEGSPRPVENISFAYSQIILTYTPRDETGAAGEKVSFGWDLAANKRI